MTSQTSTFLLHTLPLDVTVNVLKSLHSFEDLLSVICTHSTFHTIWKSNTQGVGREIAQRQFVPWADALALLRDDTYPRRRSYERRRLLATSPGSASPDKPLFSFRGETLTVEDVYYLVKDASKVKSPRNRALFREYKLSQTEGDPTPAELFRCDRAVYRIKLYFRKLAPEEKPWITPPALDQLLKSLSVVELTEVYRALERIFLSYWHHHNKPQRAMNFGLQTAVGAVISRKLKLKHRHRGGWDRLEQLNTDLGQYSILDMAHEYVEEMNSVERALRSGSEPFGPAPDSAAPAGK